MKKRWSILTLVTFLGFGYFLKSRWAEVARIDATNHKLEARIATNWQATVARREAAAEAVAKRNDRFHLRKLAAIFIDDRVRGRDHDPQEMTRQSKKLSRLSLDELTEVIDELQASSFPDDARIGIEAMLSPALAASCTGEPDHDALIHRFLMNSPVPPEPEISRPLISRIADSQLRTEVVLRLETTSPP